MLVYTFNRIVITENSQILTLSFGAVFCLEYKCITANAAFHRFILGQRMYLNSEMRKDTMTIEPLDLIFDFNWMVIISS